VDRFQAGLPLILGEYMMSEFGVILNAAYSSSVVEWAHTWSQCYSDAYLDATYESALQDLRSASNDETLRHALVAIFVWKNNGPLSTKKRKAVEGISFKMWKDWRSSCAIPKHFKSGVVWNIFLAHLLSDGKRPIFDQHTWRACCSMTAIRCKELGSIRSRERMNAYLEYEKWFNSILGNCDPRVLDRALMAYGQFLSGQFRPLLKLPEYSDEFMEPNDSTR
jgi:hypothetical protein